MFQIEPVKRKLKIERWQCKHKEREREKVHVIDSLVHKIHPLYNLIQFSQSASQANSGS